MAGRVLLASVVLHATAVALFASWLDLQREPHPVVRSSRAMAIPIVPPRRVDPTPIDITIFESPVFDPPAVGASGALPPRGPGDRSRTAIAMTQPGGGATEQVTGPRAPGHGLMHMRGPDLKANPDKLAAIAQRGERPHEVYKSGRVDSAPNGKAVIHDLVTTVEIERDGTAHLHDEPDIDVHATMPFRPWEMPADLRNFGKRIAEWAKDPEAGKRFGRMQDLPAHLQAVPGGCSSFGDPMCDDPQAPGVDKRARAYERTNGGVIMPILGGKLDLTAYLAKKLGVGDVYASRKLRLLDDSRDERVARGDRFRTEQLTRSAELMRRNLDVLWKATAKPDERRTVLFELWDECAEGEGPTGDAGQRARTEVIGWIRAKLPPDQPGAFSSAEIEALDQRRASHQHFVPY